VLQYSTDSVSAVCPKRLLRIIKWQRSCCLTVLISILSLSSWFLSRSISARIESAFLIRLLQSVFLEPAAQLGRAIANRYCRE